MEVALDFVKQVKSHLPESKSNEFFHLLRNFMSRKRPSGNTHSAIGALLHGYSDLTSDFRNIMSIVGKLEAPVAPVKAFVWSCQDMKNTESLAWCCKETSPGHKDSVMDKENMKYAIDFINKVRWILHDDDKYELFLSVIHGFLAHQKMEKVDREVNVLFAEYPVLEIEFSKFQADFNQTKRGKEKVNSRNEGKVFAPRKLPHCEVKLFACEDRMVESDILCHSLESAKNAIHALITAAQIDPEEVTNIRAYISDLNVKRLRELYSEKLKCERKLVGNKVVTSEEVLMLLRDTKIAKETITLLDKERKRATESHDQETLKWARVLTDYREKTQRRQRKRIRVR